MHKCAWVSNLNIRNKKKNKVSCIGASIAISIRTHLCIHAPRRNGHLRQCNFHISILKLVAHSVSQFLDMLLHLLLPIHNGIGPECSFERHIVPFRDCHETNSPVGRNTFLFHLIGKSVPERRSNGWAIFMVILS